MPNCIIGLLSFVIIIFVTFVYFIKARINSFETKIYGYMILIDLFITIFAVLFFFAVDIPDTFSLLRDFIGKGICVLFVAWYALFATYLTYLIINKDEKGVSSKIFIPFLIFFFVLSAMIIILPFQMIKSKIYFRIYY